MMKLYTASPAAARAGIEPRTLKLLVDRKLIEVAEKKGRGAAQFFSIDEIVIARVLGDLIALGMNTAEISGFAKWLREQTTEAIFADARAGKPVALKIAVRRAGFLDSILEFAEIVGDQPCVTLLEPNSKTEQAERLIVFNLPLVIAVAQKDMREFVRQSFKPSFVVTPVHRENVLRMLATHNDDEINEFFDLAARCASSGDVWHD